LKRNITKSILGLDFINALEPVSYQWRDEEVRIEKRRDVERTVVLENGTETKRNETETYTETATLTHDRTHYGLIAQQVLETLNKFGLTSDDFGGYNDPAVQNKTGYIALAYTQFISPMIRAIQELSAKVEAPVVDIPPTPSSPCTQGTQVYTTSHMYKCIHANTWRRIALESSW
jgi:hypothetical protein